MNFNAVNVTMFGIGAILLYSAIKDKTPKDVIANAFQSQKSNSGPRKAPHSPTVSGPAGSTSSKPRNNFAEPFSTPAVYPSN